MKTANVILYYMYKHNQVSCRINKWSYCNRRFRDFGVRVVQHDSQSRQGVLGIERLHPAPTKMLDGQAQESVEDVALTQKIGETRIAIK